MVGRKPLVGVPPDGTHSFGGTTYGVQPYFYPKGSEGKGNLVRESKLGPSALNPLVIC